MQYKCEICDKEFKSLWGLSSHSVQKHDSKPKDLYIKHKLNGDKPTCKCGCGEQPNFLGVRKGFNDFIRGHSSRVNNNWGHNESAQKKSKETLKKKYERGQLTIWNKGLTKDDDSRLDYGEKISTNKERNSKISKALKGRKRPKKVLDKLDEGMRNYWSKEENREKRRLEQSDRIKQFQYNNKTLLEKSFEVLLIDLSIEYVSQHTVCGYNYDYYLPKYNTLIEVDGDFWHCNPIKFPNGPLFESQEITIKNDVKKNDICENIEGLTLIRFWETDINERPEWVKKKIMEFI